MTTPGPDIPPGHYSPRMPSSPLPQPTVWPCPASGDARPTPWLLAAVERTATTHTRPGHAVLLLAPPVGDGGTDGPGTFDDLPDAVGTVSRLGRRVRVRTVLAADGRPRPPATTAADVDRSPSPDRVRRADGDPDRYEMVVACVEPSAAGWVHDVLWDRLLAPSGTLAFVTHCESRGGWLIDPTLDLTTAVRRHGLAPVDRVVLLEIPFSQHPLTFDRTTGPFTSDDAAARRVHSDLLLFAPVLTSASSRNLRTNSGDVVLPATAAVPETGR